jgi:signal transduction histidine kinase/CheY-like chemotaxis protein
MIEDYKLIGYDFTIYYDLIVVVVLLFTCMVGLTFWVARQRMTPRFILSGWGIFIGIVILGVACIISTVNIQKLVWFGYFAKTANSYAHVIMQFENWKIQLGHEELFSDWTAPVSPQSVEQFTHDVANVTERVNYSQYDISDISRKLEPPENLTAQISNGIVVAGNTLQTDYSQTQVRRNQWGLVAITGDNQAYQKSTKYIAVWWSERQSNLEHPTFRLQWRRCYQPDNFTDWFDVYSGTQNSCVLRIPDGIEVEFRVRAEDGTPENDINYLQLMDACDLPVTANAYIGYAYTLRQIDGEEDRLRFVVSPISDANHNLLIDIGERPTQIGEVYETTPLFRYVCEAKRGAVNVAFESDSWGSWFTVAEPLWTPDGKFDGVFGIDFHANVMLEHLRRGKIFPYCFFIAVVALFFGSMVFITHLQKISEAKSSLADKLQITVLELTEAEHVAENASRAKTHFLTNMSHEIRTPLNAILGYTDVIGRKLLQRCLPDERDECQMSLNQIVGNGNDLLAIINDILEFAVFDGDKDLKVEQVPVNVRALLAEITRIMLQRVENKPITLTVTDNGNVPEYILSDPARIRQVLVNMIGNAIKFTEKGTIKIEYGADLAELQNGILHNDDSVQRTNINTGEQNIFFSVADTGIGIVPEDLELIFKPFSQADASLTRRYGGIGIGLSVSKSVAEALGGRIDVTSMIGVGSTFRFMFRALAASDENALKALRPTQLPKDEAIQNITESSIHKDYTRVLAGRRILLVEDTKINQLVISAQLKDAGCEITVADNGQIGVEKVSEAEAAGEPFDVILMDMQMPVLDGYEATTRLRKQGYKRPIIAVTAHALAGDREKTIQAGCDEYLPKPVNRDNLIKMILSFVGYTDNG